jgi:hypothetical protein
MANSRKSQVYVAINDDGMSLNTLARSTKDAKTKMVKALKITGLCEVFEEVEPWEDDLEDSYISIDHGETEITTQEFFERQGISEIVEDVVVVSVCNDAEQYARVIDLRNPELTTWEG